MNVDGSGELPDLLFGFGIALRNLRADLLDDAIPTSVKAAKLREMEKRLTALLRHVGAVAGELERAHGV